jgi:hypothetical protein
MNAVIVNLCVKNTAQHLQVRQFREKVEEEGYCAAAKFNDRLASYEARQAEELALAAAALLQAAHSALKSPLRKHRLSFGRTHSSTKAAALHSPPRQQRQHSSGSGSGSASTSLSPGRNGRSRPLSAQMVTAKFSNSWHSGTAAAAPSNSNSTAAATAAAAADAATATARRAPAAELLRLDSITGDSSSSSISSDQQQQQQQQRQQRNSGSLSAGDSDCGASSFAVRRESSLLLEGSPAHFHPALYFIEALTSVSQELIAVPVAHRQEAMTTKLERLNEFFLSEAARAQGGAQLIYMPFGDVFYQVSGIVFIVYGVSIRSL